MKAGVVAAAGNLGGRVTSQCLDRGWHVTAFVNNHPCRDARAQQVHKSLFALTKNDIQGMDVLFSAFGSGFAADPTLNRQALYTLGRLVQGTQTRLVTIVGAGCLYTDASKAARCFEAPDYPAFLRGISENTALGVQDVMAMQGVRYTFVCPGQRFDPDTPGTGHYRTDTSMVLPFDQTGASYTTYDDMAKAMADFAGQDLFDGAFVTVLSAAGN